jgi:dCMP deaminase
LVWEDPTDSTEHFASGFNRFPSGVTASRRRWRRPTKYRYVIHAEVDVILWGLAELPPDRLQKNVVLYAPWAACNECAKIIIQAGIPHVVAHRQAHLRTQPHWRKSVKQGIAMMREAGVRYEQWDGKVGGVKNLFDGVWWEP